MPPDWIATYRLQLHADFPLGAAEKLLPYLVRLGISHVYLSPCLQDRPGSTHGYDMTDPTRISEERGGEEGWRSFCAAARAQGLGILLDIVSNHMAVGAENHWWDDLLAHGQYSRFNGFFDIPPDPSRPILRIRLTLLPESYGAVLKSGGFAIDTAGPRPRLRCGDLHWPLHPGSWGLLLEGEPADHPAFAEAARLGGIAQPSAEERAEYEQAVQAIDAHWQSLPDDLRRAVAARLPSDPEAMHRLIERQTYILHTWKLGGEIVNYRRFFDIASLVGVRMEAREVFVAAHQRIAAMIQAGEVHGLRVDHPDGLRAPAAYFRQLRELIPDGRIYAEKILGDDEVLRPDWAVDGTVGYEFLNKVNRLWMSEQKADQFSSVYADYTGHTINFPRVVREKKLEIMDTAFLADLERLTHLATELARASWRTQDLSRRELRAAIREVTMLFPVYRTYLLAHPPNPIDREMWEGVLASARARRPDLQREVFDFFGELLAAPRLPAGAEELFARWQQLTPAVTAKGIEDTTFYCYDRLVSCNEVGSQPSLVGISSEQFHQFCHRLGTAWPRNLLATSTHDTKRGEDVRARISVLSEDPEAWAKALQEWSHLNLKRWLGRQPDRHAEYLLYQTLVGAWPLSRERAIEYMVKACREAKINTSWHNPDERYEEAMRDFIMAIFESAEFTESLAAFVRPLLLPGRINGLSQTLIKLTAPGTTDFYQGTELWDMSLVDPDNRRPVDFERRAQLLERARAIGAKEALEDWDSGMPKLWLISRLLDLRRREPAWFAGGSYKPLSPHGSRLGHLLGFMRAEQLIALVPRFTYTLRGDWGDTVLHLPPGRWTNHFTGRNFQGEALPGALFAEFPVALLVRQA